MNALSEFQIGTGAGPVLLVILIVDGSGMFNLPDPLSSSIYSAMSSVQEITEAIERLAVKDQVRLLQELPQHLKISPDDAGWPKLAEPAFKFWDNPDDAVYDTL